MNDREKKLAAAVGILVVLGAIYLVYGYVDGLLVQRNNEKTRLTKEVQDKKDEFELGRRAVAEIRDYERRSLPSDLQLTQSEYPAWLQQQWEAVGIDNAKVTPKGIQTRGGPFQDMRFEIRAQANLVQVVEFLHRFYSVDDLHRVYSLQLDRDPNDEKLLTVTVNVDAACLRTAAQAKSIGRPLDKPSDVATYLDSIVARNPFAPANRPPKFDRLGTQRETVGQISLDLDASDRDEGDKLTYEIIEGPEGARVSRSGTFAFRARQPGEHTVKVRVFDDGIPSKEDVATFNLIVEKAPPRREPQREPPPEFDDAEHTVMISTFSNGQRREVWLHVRTTGKMLKLREGEDFRVGSMAAVVHRVGNGDAQFRTDDGMLSVEVGDRLTQGEAVGEGT